MSDEEFLSFGEIIFKNFKVIEDMFNCIFYQRPSAIDEIEFFRYNDLFQYYYNENN